MEGTSRSANSSNRPPWGPRDDPAPPGRSRRRGAALARSDRAVMLDGAREALVEAHQRDVAEEPLALGHVGQRVTDVALPGRCMAPGHGSAEDPLEPRDDLK